MLAFALTIFLGAYLLFQVQPLIAKYILPWFGGGPGVWTTCMLFFQTVLLAGYAYAHLLARRLSPRAQVMVHTGVLILAASLLPITPGTGWKPEGAETPALRIVTLLAACLGVQAFALSTTGPLMQRWFAESRPGTSPYRLYALSNLGSLLALVGYPFLVEPFLSRDRQGAWWSVGFGVYAVLAFVCGLRIWKGGRRKEGAEGEDPPSDAAGESVRPGRWILWLLLPACASLLLLAVTSQLCLDVAVIPFLWVLPLSLYLLSFILSFHSPHWYPRPVYLCVLLLSLWALSWVMVGAERKAVSIPVQVLAQSGVLFLCCMVCHGELARLAPKPRRLTAYYLSIATGGAVGGLLAAVVAPLVFRGYFELHVGLVACVVLALAVVFVDRDWILYRGRPIWAWIPLVMVVVALTLSLVRLAAASITDARAVSRNFYGVLYVTEKDADDPDMHMRILTHGNTLHGAQFTSARKHGQPTTYYGPESGMGLAIRHHGARGPIRVGAVGLGVGTAAAYGRKGDEFRFYEINPEVLRLAESWFTYLSDTSAEVGVVLGDARVSLERDPPQGYDVIVLDAFSSDAIPVHLLTREAFEIYRSHLKPDGTIAVHISNAYLDLRPVVFAQADHLGLSRVLVSDIRGKNRRPEEARAAGEDARAGLQTSFWVLATGDPTLLESPVVRRQSSLPQTEVRRIRLWTDDDSNLFDILRD